MTSRRRISVLAFAVAVLLGGAQANAGERGFPLMTVYGQRTHHGGGQTFDVAQDARGVIYFANLQGILIYDGAWWRKIALPNDSAAFAIESNDLGEVAAGGAGEIGLVVPAESGEATYRSLVSTLPGNARTFGDVQSICATDRGFLFLTDRFAIDWNGAESRVIAEAGDHGPFPKRAFRIGSDVYLAGGDGLQKLDRTTMRVEPASLPGKRVSLALEAGAGRILAVTREEGLFVVTADGRFTAIESPASAWLRGKTVTGGCRLRDGRLVITTREDGVLIVDANGDPDQLIDHAAGLPDDVLAGAITDREGALWLPMHGPLVRIDIDSPISLFDSRSGIKGSVNSAQRIEGRLYVGTSHGLFVLDSGPSEGVSRRVARAIPGIAGSVWHVVPTADGTIVAATTDGIFTLHGDEAPRRIAGTEGITCYKVIPAHDQARMWVLTRQFIGSLTHDASGWHFAGPIPGTPPHTRSLIERDGVLWGGTIFNGIVRVDMKQRPPSISYIGHGEMRTYDIGGRLLFGGPQMLMHLRPDGRTLEPDPIVRIRPEADFFFVAANNRGELWINTKPPRRFLPDAKGDYSGEGDPVVSVDAPDLPLIAFDPDGTVWFGSANGIYRYEPHAPSPPQPRPYIRVSSGAKAMRHSFGRLRLEFAPASYETGLAYQYRLEPLDTTWSAWTSEPFIDFTNLGAGDYTFHLRTRGAHQGVSEETGWSFTVLPPWYQTPWATALWIILGAGIVALIVRLRTRALHRQADLLREKIAERTDELRKTNELLQQANGRLERLSLLDELTGIANRRYLQRALADDWERARDRRQPLALILIDLDHFKNLNDTLGHQAGDDCLREIGNFLANQLRRSGELATRVGDVVARYGGEEFVVLLTDSDDQEALRVAERLRSGIEALGSITASCGVASMTPTGNEQMTVLIERADRALYAAKYDGRNRVRFAADDAA